MKSCPLSMTIKQNFFLKEKERWHPYIRITKSIRATPQLQRHNSNRADTISNPGVMLSFNLDWKCGNMKSCNGYGILPLLLCHSRIPHCTNSGLKTHYWVAPGKKKESKETNLRWQQNWGRSLLILMSKSGQRGKRQPTVTPPSQPEKNSTTVPSC